MKKPNTSIVASAIALAAAFFTAPALAGNNVFKQGEADGDSDYLASNSANWWQPGQVSTDADTGETTITEMSFSNPFVTTFDKLIKTTTYCWIGATDGAYDADDAWCVWRTKGNSSEYGFTQSGNNHVVMADASTQKGRLRIESGTYTAQTFQIGGNSGMAYLDVSNATLRATGDFRVASLNGGSTKGYVTIRDGAVVTAGANIAIGTESGVTADVTVTNATVAVTGTSYIGRNGGTATLTVEKDATFSSIGDISIGSNGSGSSGKLIVDGGEVLAKYWLTAGRDGNGNNTAEIEVKSGSLKLGEGTENGQFDLSDTANTTTTFKQSGGYVYAPGGSGVALALSRNDTATATYEMTGGTLELGGVLDVGCNGTGTFAMSNGTVTASKYMRLGFGANSVANVYISGGELTAGGSTDNKNYYGLMLADNASSTATFTIDGGTATFIHDSNIGWNGSGTLNIGGTGKVSVGTASAHKWVRMNTQASATGKSVINLSGNGILDICHVELDNGMGEINFDGGAIHAYANNGNCGGVVIAASDNLTVNVKEGGAAFDVPSGVSVSIAEPLLAAAAEGNTDGGLVKKGDGTLTLASGNTYAGSTVVKGGSLVLPEGGSLASTQLELAGGTFSGTTFDDIVISAGAYSFSSLPTNTTSTVTLNGGVLRMTVAEAQATADTARVVVNGGTLLIDGSTAESVSVGSSFTFGNVTLGDDVEAADVVKVSGVNFDWTYGSSDGHPTATAGTASGENVWVGGAEGYWKDNINWTYGVPATGATARFDTDATVLFDANKTIASIVVNATVMFKSTDLGSVHPTVYIHDVDGTGTIQLYHVGFEGNGGDKRIGSSSGNTLTLEFAVASTDSWLKYVNVYAPVTGSGYARFYDGTWLYGDNSSFTGKVRKDDGDVRFMAPEAGFPNAHTVEMYGTIWLWFSEGEIAFGGNFTANNAANSSRGINLPIGVSNVTLTLGGGNGYVNIGRQYIHPSGFTSFYGVYVGDGGSNWTAGTDKFTIRKIGSGTMNYLGVESVYNLSVEGGVAMVDPTIADPKWSNLNLTVKDGATFIVDAGISIASADFQRGSKLQSTYYETTEEETTTYGVNLLTVTGAATLNGLTLTAAGTTPNVDTTYTVLSAASVSGSAESGVADSDETDKKVWIAKVRQDSVMLMYGSRHPGFFVIIH